MASLTRRELVGRSTIFALGFPMISMANCPVSASSQQRYSTRAIDIVRQSLVIDMLAPLKIEAAPAFSAVPLSAKDAQEFLSSGITGFHHSFGLGGPALSDKRGRC